MKYYDITREMISSPVYPGGYGARLEECTSMLKGDVNNSNLLHCSLHAGTHCDAFLHFIANGLDISAMPLEHYIGPCYVLTVPENTIVDVLFLENYMPEGIMRLLIRSNGTSYMSLATAKWLRARGVITIGLDSYSVASMEEDQDVHVAFLGHGIAIIESLDLSCVSDGHYNLFAPPLKIGKAEASACRALLFDF